jgi:hypothetical protein
MAAKIKSIVFRVTGLEAGQPDDELEAALKAVINHSLSEEEKSGIKAITAIVPSCHDGERERVALVEFRGRVPKFLSKLVAHPLEDWQIEMGDADSISRLPANPNATPQQRQAASPDGRPSVLVSQFADSASDIRN